MPKRLLADLRLAAALLTRLPVGGWPADAARPADAVWAYPVVGAAVGAIGAGVLWLGRAIGLPPLLAAAWAVLAMTLATGALHEDGLSDTADGFGGGTTRARKLDIMRDSRIGGFGALALGFTLLIRVGALTVLAPAALIAVAAAARVAAVGVLALLPPARPDGLGAAIGPVSPPRAAAAAGLAVLAAFLAVPARAALLALLATTAAGLGTVWLARRQIGGQTGDVCGAAEQAAECLALTAMAAALAR